MLGQNYGCYLYISSFIEISPSVPEKILRFLPYMDMTMDMAPILIRAGYRLQNFVKNLVFPVFPFESLFDQI